MFVCAHAAVCACKTGHDVGRELRVGEGGAALKKGGKASGKSLPLQQQRQSGKSGLSAVAGPQREFGLVYEARGLRSARCVAASLSHDAHAHADSRAIVELTCCLLLLWV